MVHQEDSEKQNRLFFLDNLRTFLIFLVVVTHAGWVYEKSGILSSVWIVDDPLKNDLAGILNLIIDIFLMPTMFFISGYFAALSLKTKNEWVFLKFRFKRLIIPWGIAVLTLIPLYKVIFLYSRNLPQENLISYFHFSGEVLINQGWLWFLPVLFLFDLLYVILSRLNPIKFEISLKGVVLLVFLFGITYSFCMSYFNLYGWTKTVVLDFQNERLLIYFMIFVLGSFSYKLNAFSGEASKKKLYYTIVSTVWIPMNLYIIFLVNLFLNPGNYIFSRAIDLMLVWFGFHLSMLGMLYIMISTFKYYLNKKIKIMQRLNSYSYGVYMLHFVVMGCVAAILLNVSIASLTKYAILAVATYVLSNMVLAIYKVMLQMIFQKTYP